MGWGQGRELTFSIPAHAGMQPHLELWDVYNKSHLLILHMKYSSTNDHMEQTKASSLIY